MWAEPDQEKLKLHYDMYLGVTAGLQSMYMFQLSYVMINHIPMALSQFIDQ